MNYVMSGEFWSRVMGSSTVAAIGEEAPREIGETRECFVWSLFSSRVSLISRGVMNYVMFGEFWSRVMRSLTVAASGEEAPQEIGETRECFV